jgi:hypothetical protein
MYTDFLRMAVDQAERPGGGATTGMALATLLQCRDRLSGPGLDGSSGIANDLFAELDYDVALIGLCQLLGIQTEIRAFEDQRRERSRLEQELVDRGIRLVELEGENPEDR